MVFWVFGYGSLVWNPGFAYDEKVIGFIKNYRRVFDLGTFPISLYDYEVTVLLVMNFVLLAPQFYN